MADLNSSLYGVVVNWDDIPSVEIRPGVRRKVYSTDSVMLARHELSLEMELNPHSHADFDQLVFIASGECEYFFDGEARKMGPGSFLLVPRGVEHFVRPTIAPCINIDIFSPPRTDFASDVTWLY